VIPGSAFARRDIIFKELRVRTLKLGDRGKEVLDVQSRLCGLGYSVGTDGVDGYFGDDTEKAVLKFQQECGLLVDGIVSDNTWCELVEAGNEPGERLLYLRIPSFRGADVLMLQRSLNCLGFNAGPEDGIFGSLTERAVLDFQRNAGLVMDGMVDESVLKVIDKVTKDGEPHSAEAKIPDRNGGCAGGRSLSETTISIDPGHGGNDSGSVADTGIIEKDINLSVALALGRALESLGARVVLTRDKDEAVPLYKRPVVANAAGADIFISIHHNSNPSPLAQGATAYFFSRQGYFSEAGKMLAQHIVTALAANLDVPELPAMGRNFAVLRETEMTAVQVEPVFISNPELGKIDIEELSRLEAEAILDGINRYFAT